jgi:hypothetical protein
MAFGIVIDGVQPFKDDSGYGFWAIVLTPLNFHPSVRYNLGMTHILGLVPGTRTEGTTVDLDSVMEVIQCELNWLYRNGIRIFDAATGEMFR